MENKLKKVVFRKEVSRVWESRKGLPLGAVEAGMGKIMSGLERVLGKDQRLFSQDAQALDRAGFQMTLLEA